MADGEASSPNQADLVQTAQSQISQVMDNAVQNVTNNAMDSEMSEFLKKHWSGEKVQEQVEYVEPMQDPYNKAITYLENHNILQLFQQLTASIVYNKPEQPLEYMMQEVEKMKKEREKENTTK